MLSLLGDEWITVVLRPRCTLRAYIELETLPAITRKSFGKTKQEFPQRPLAELLVLSIDQVHRFCIHITAASIADCSIVRVWTGVMLKSLTK